ncbi:helix-turn-helix domain-containing protein [Dysgonomonas sp. Marseille-P4677]|uniref:AraC family transcriptional regulator n=1 Tax=Dysgonomonas sp. Marseille-P4677 TaxID=2364790 RepID=UPI0019127BE9|nr:helix-turn-helix domain-containing protein [Dysgonomonas sp. Marseille-P4677]
MIWRKWYLIFYVVYNLVFIALIFVGCHNADEPEFVNERLLIWQINLLLTLHLVVTIALVYVKIPDDSIGAIINKQRIWIILLFLFSSILLKGHYLLRTNAKNNNRYTQLDQIEHRCGEYRNILVSLFEDQKIYLRQDLDKELLSIESGISRADLNYFFEKYIEVDFRVFIAGYRIRYALDLLNTNKNMYTMEFIASQCGYKSLVTFNKYFISFTGLTPSQYVNDIEIYKPDEDDLIIPNHS